MMSSPAFGGAQVGYPSLSSFIASSKSMDMFKRFSELNIRNLLYMQAELLYLQDELNVITFVDHSSRDGIEKDFSQNAVKMIKASRASGSEQWLKILEIRDKLKEYNEALLRQSRLSALPNARAHDLGIVQEWISQSGPYGGDSFLSGVEAQPWEPDDASDLAALSGREHFDFFTKMLAEKIMPWFFEKIYTKIKSRLSRAREDTGMVNMKDENFEFSARIISIFFSAFMPSIAVVVLYFIPTMLGRLGAIVGFSFLFAGILAIFTTAKPVEIFAITAACASVQVVFVGSTSTVRP